MPEPAQAVFLSYASQDAEIARRICEALRADGVEVWFDAAGGLEHGDEWDSKIRRQIKECVLFLPVISASTQARLEGYFRIEWELAAERAMGFAHNVPFILPIVVDATGEAEALVPERFRAPESLVMTYDGKASSVYAIRQFAYLFPELSELECLLVGADEEPDASLPQAQLIEELVSRHYPHLTIRHFAGEDREGFRQWLGARQDCLLVTGAYGRGEVSSLFRKSFVADLIREHRMPIFIAHG